MLWNAKNGCLKIDDIDMDYVSFGHGNKVLIVLPGLSDGLLTVKGKALLLAKPYVDFFKNSAIIISVKGRGAESADPMSVVAFAHVAEWISTN